VYLFFINQNNSCLCSMLWYWHRLPAEIWWEMAVVGHRSSSVCPMPVFHEAIDLRRLRPNNNSLLTTNGQCIVEKQNSDWDRPIGYGAFGVVWQVLGLSSLEIIFSYDKVEWFISVQTMKHRSISETVIPVAVFICLHMDHLQKQLKVYTVVMAILGFHAVK